MASTRRRLVPIAVVVVVVGALVAGAAALGLFTSEVPVEPASVRLASSKPEASLVSGTWKAEDPGFLVADALGATVGLYSSPDVPLADKPSLDNPTHEGLAVVFRVLEQKGGWLRVMVSSRPNGLEAWVRRSEVSLRTVPNHVLVEVGARRVTVFRGDEVLLQETVAVGTSRTPTPLGSFFVDGIVDVPNDNGPYGAFQVSVSGFSEVLTSFGGGSGQIALHGTNRPALLGQPVSNGCVRMTNAAITRMASLAPTGTPVEIVA